MLDALVSSRTFALRLSQSSTAIDKRWCWWSAAMLGCLALLVTADLHRRGQIATQGLLQIELDSLVTSSATRPAAPVARADFTKVLVTGVTAERFLGILEHTCADAEATLLSTTVSQRASAPGDLTAIDFSVALRGRYEALKLVLVEVLQRVPTATVKQLRMRQEPARAGATTEAHVVFSVWSGPAVRSGDAAARAATAAPAQ